jgi:hypothetical protein
MSRNKYDGADPKGDKAHNAKPGTTEKPKKVISYSCNSSWHKRTRSHPYKFAQRMGCTSHVRVRESEATILTETRNHGS